MIDWKPCREGGVGAELECAGFRAFLWAWPDVSEGAEIFCARALVTDREGDEPFDRSNDSAESQEEAQQKAADILQLYLDGDPEEQAFRAKLRAWVAPDAEATT